MTVEHYELLKSMRNAYLHVVETCLFKMHEIGESQDLEDLITVEMCELTLREAQKKFEHYDAQLTSNPL